MPDTGCAEPGLLLHQDFDSNPPPLSSSSAELTEGTATVCPSAVSTSLMSTEGFKPMVPSAAGFANTNVMFASGSGLQPMLDPISSMHTERLSGDGFQDQRDIAAPQLFSLNHGSHQGIQEQASFPACGDDRGQAGDAGGFGSRDLSVYLDQFDPFRLPFHSAQQSLEGPDDGTIHQPDGTILHHDATPWASPDVRFLTTASSANPSAPHSAPHSSPHSPLNGLGFDYPQFSDEFGESPPTLGPGSDTVRLPQRVDQRPQAQQYRHNSHHADLLPPQAKIMPQWGLSTPDVEMPQGDGLATQGGGKSRGASAHIEAPSCASKTRMKRGSRHTDQEDVTSASNSIGPKKSVVDDQSSTALVSTPAASDGFAVIADATCGVFHPQTTRNGHWRGSTASVIGTTTPTSAGLISSKASSSFDSVGSASTGISSPASTNRRPSGQEYQYQHHRQDFDSLTWESASPADTAETGVSMSPRDPMVFPISSSSSSSRRPSLVPVPGGPDVSAYYWKAYPNDPVAGGTQLLSSMTDGGRPGNISCDVSSNGTQIPHPNHQDYQRYSLEGNAFPYSMSMSMAGGSGVPVIQTGVPTLFPGHGPISSTIHRGPSPSLGTSAPALSSDVGSHPPPPPTVTTAAVTAGATLSSPNIEIEYPSESELKKEDLRRRNRKAASKCRAKTKDAETRLRDEAWALTATWNDLSAKARELEKEVKGLKREIRKHGCCGNPLIDAYLRKGRLATHGQQTEGDDGESSEDNEDGGAGDVGPKQASL